MIKIFTYVFAILLLVGCQNNKTLTAETVKDLEVNSDNVENFRIIIHGGAGTIKKEYMSDSLENVYKDKLKEAISVGHEILKNGGTSMEAVTRTINILEDSPLFNAGKGCVFTHEGSNELDASIMDGSDLNAGAVAGVKHIKNPIDLARDVMEKSPHVMLYGAGAETFAKGLDYDMVDTTYFYTQERYDVLQRVLQKEEESKNVAFADPTVNDYKFGTVGCAALDKHGNLAAGTSTGGMTNKRWNRIGDSPIIGAGTYANNATCAVSATGWGEFFIRGVVAHDISALMEYKGLSLKEAAEEVIQNKIPELGGDGGIVAIDKDGNITMEFNTAGMYRAAMNSKGEMTIGLYKEDE